MSYLQYHHQRSYNQNYSYDILHNDKDAAQHHLGMITKRAFDDIDRFVSHHLYAWNNAGNNTCQYYECKTNRNRAYSNVIFQYYPSLEECGKLILEVICKEESDKKRYCDKKYRLNYQSNENIAHTASEQSSGCQQQTATMQ